MAARDMGLSGREHDGFRRGSQSQGPRWSCLSWKYPRMGVRAARSVGAQGSATAQSFLFRGAQAIFGGTEVPAGSGARVIREWRGAEQSITVLKGGFEWQGRSCKSLP